MLFIRFTDLTVEGSFLWEELPRWLLRGACHPLRLLQDLRRLLCLLWNWPGLPHHSPRLRVSSKGLDKGITFTLGAPDIFVRDPSPSDFVTVVIKFLGSGSFAFVSYVGRGHIYFKITVYLELNLTLPPRLCSALKSLLACRGCQLRLPCICREVSFLTIPNLKKKAV